MPQTAERIAQEFHDLYERLAPEYGYVTREETQVEWANVPAANRLLMIAVVRELLAAGKIRPGELLDLR